jgi:hypothetical protein
MQTHLRAHRVSPLCSTVSPSHPDQGISERVYISSVIAWSRRAPYQPSPTSDKQTKYIRQRPYSCHTYIPDRTVRCVTSRPSPHISHLPRLRKSVLRLGPRRAGDHLGKSLQLSIPVCIPSVDNVPDKMHRVLQRSPSIRRTRLGSAQRRLSGVASAPWHAFGRARAG